MKIATYSIRKDEEDSAGGNTPVERIISVNPEDCCLYLDDQYHKAGHYSGSNVPLRLQALINRVIPLAGSTETMKQSYHYQVELTMEAREELTCWSQAAGSHNAAPIMIPPPDIVIKTDASHVGWVPRCQDQRTGGLWSVKEQDLHINALELTALLLAV